MKIKENYLIGETTLALLPFAHETLQTMIIDLNGVFYCSRKPFQVVDDSCQDGGASYDGRRKAIKRYTGITQKVPAPIKTHDYIYAVPTHSPEQYECIWIIAHNFIDAYPAKNGEKTIIKFKNDSSIEVPNVSSSIIFKQLTRTCFVAARFSPSNRFSFWINSTDGRITRSLPGHTPPVNLILEEKEEEKEKEEIHN
ncbi:competence protein ComK [Cytobacillus suaedae]|nr:competence protein ComK [Cytobacillus suaedae]